MNIYKWLKPYDAGELPNFDTQQFFAKNIEPITFYAIETCKISSECFKKWFAVKPLQNFIFYRNILQNTWLNAPKRYLEILRTTSLFWNFFIFVLGNNVSLTIKEKTYLFSN